MRPGQPVEIRIDAYPGRKLTGHVESVQPGSGTAFSLLPAENATGNFVKVVQRVPVKIVVDDWPADLAGRPGHVGRALDKGAMTDARTARTGGWSPERSAAGGHNPYLIAFVVSIATFMEVLDTTIANVALAPHRRRTGGRHRREHLRHHQLSRRQRDRAVDLGLAVDGHRPQALLHDLRRRSSPLRRCCADLPGICESLVLFRILQGLGGGGMATSEQAILADSFPPHKRGQAFAIYGMAVVVAPVIGPTLGGWITDTYSWHWVFLINVPMGLLSLFLVGTLVSEPSGAEEERQKLLQQWTARRLCRLRAGRDRAGFARIRP